MENQTFTSIDKQKKAQPQGKLKRNSLFESQLDFYHQLIQGFSPLK